MEESGGNSLRPFIPVIISTGGGGITLDLLHKIKPHYDEELPQIQSYQPPIAVNGGSGDGTSSSSSSGKCLDPVVNNPMPLQCFKVVIGGEGCSISANQIRGGSRKRKRAVGDESPPPLAPPSALVAEVERCKANKAVFLCRKKLEVSDVKKNQNRLMVTERKAVEAFLTKEEMAAVAKLGLKICGVDGNGEIYRLALKAWKSVKQMAINLEWNKVVAKNNAEAGDVVELWGFREEDDKLSLGVVFKKTH